MHKKAHLSDTVTFLSENNYEIGYATYWESNIVTEITDGDIQLIPLSLDEDSGNILYFNCLTSQSLREQPNDAPFLLLTQDSKIFFEKSDSVQYCDLIYEDEYHCVYSINDLNSFIYLLYS